MSGILNGADADTNATICVGMSVWLAQAGPSSHPTNATEPSLDCVDHKHRPNRKLDQIPVDNPVSITGGSGSYLGR